MSKVSVIIPTWNRAATIEKAVRSALNQTFSPLEVLVCDDGSTDNTIDIVHAINDPRVRWIPGTHSGLPAAPRNRGIKESKGEWLAFLDSDDEWLPEKLEQQLYLADKLNCKAVSTNASRYIAGKGMAGELLLHDKNRITFKDLIAGNQVICSSALVHISLFDEIKGFPEDMELKAIEDYALWLRIATLTDFAYAPSPLLIYRDDEETCTRLKGIINGWQQRICVFDNFVKWGKEHKLSSKFIKSASLQYDEAYRKLNPPVTVLMPVFNGEKHLREAIESILRQTLADFEFLIIDDGSTDSSMDIMKSYDDPRIRIVQNKKNMGLIYCLNMGLEAARGEYIARMDCDDISAPDRLARQARFMDDNTGTGVCGTWIKLFDENGSYIVKHPITSEEIESALFFYNCIAHPSVMLNKSLFNKFNLRYRDEFFYAEDYKLWTECIQHFRIANVPKALLKYRITKGGISRNSNGKMLKIINLVHKELFGPFGMSPEPDILMTHKKIGDRMQSSRPLLPEEISFADRAVPHLQNILELNEKQGIYSALVLEKIVGDFWFTLCAGLAGTGIKTRSLYFSLELKRNVRARHLLKLHIFFYWFFRNTALRMVKTHFRSFYDLIKKHRNSFLNKGNMS